MKNNNMVFAAMAIFAFGSNLSAAAERQPVINNQPTAKIDYPSSIYSDNNKRAIATAVCLQCCNIWINSESLDLSSSDREKCSENIFIGCCLNGLNWLKNNSIAEKNYEIAQLKAKFKKD